MAKSAPVVKVTRANFESEVLGSDVPALVDFLARCCVYCKKVAPVHEALAPKFSGKVKSTLANFDDEQPLSERFDVMSLLRL
ncbi:MAG TPA: thioredoxin domain-containing protein [Thermoplasmata archaeon]|nr:thioredoxin domain-containing protein [Thermoplasmata archaeon]